MFRDEASCYRAVAGRDRRFEGLFVVAVRTTGVYCRPGCPAPLPRRRNARFFSCAAAAEEAGFRPCRRCRPETAPGTPAWAGTSSTVQRALRLIDEGALDGAGTESLAQCLGIGERHLRRLFAEHVGASPAAIARTRRAHFARKLINETGLPMTEVALGAGYASIRAFNEAMQRTFRRPPRELRGAAAGSGDRGPSLRLRLPYRRPLPWTAVLSYLGQRAIPGVERVQGDTYRRTIELAGDATELRVRPAPEGDALELRLGSAPSRDLMLVVGRVSHLFDLRADPQQIADHLGRDADLRPRLERLPGLRVPGAWDPFELAVRAILGQQVSVATATTLAGRLAEGLGRTARPGAPDRVFPGPEQLAEADLKALGVVTARAEAVRGLARAVAGGELQLASRAGGLDESLERLQSLRGIGPWTAHYVALRGLGEPDAFPAGDLGLRKALVPGSRPLSTRELERRAEAWRPWRGYAAMALWMSGPEQEVSGARKRRR